MPDIDSKDFILTKKIHNIIYELIPKTRANMVYMDNEDKVTLTEKIFDICGLLSTDKENIVNINDAIKKILGDISLHSFQSFNDVWNYVNISEDSTSTIANMFKQKVSIEEGKGLSTNDFDNLSKEKLSDLYNRMELDLILEKIGEDISHIGNISEILENRIKFVEDAIKEADEKLANITKFINEKFIEVDEKIEKINEDIKELKEKPNIISTSDPLNDVNLKALSNGTWFHLVSQL